MSHVAFYLDDNALEMFEERLAILMFDGGLGEKEAELKAYRETMARASVLSQACAVAAYYQ